MKKIFSRILFFIFLSSIVACANSNEGLKSVQDNEVEDLSPNNGGRVVIATGNINTFNPLLCKNEDYYHISKLIFDQLFVVQKNGKIAPSLAEHYSLSRDGLTLSVTIRDNIYWEDGSKLTAKDVADTFNALKFLPKDSPYYQMLRHSVTMAESFNIESFARAIVFDEKNIDFQFDKPYGNNLQMLTFPIFPSHLMNPDQMVSSDQFLVKGTGPFLLKSFEENKKIILSKNPNYHQNVPFIEEIEIRILGNKNKEKQAFEAGQLDFLSLDDYTWDKYRADGKVKLESINTNNLELLAFNLENPLFADEEGLALRQAISRGINKRRIIDSLHLSQAMVSSSLLNKELSAGLLLEEEVYYNTETSEKILRDAKFKDLNGDGWIERPNGEPLYLEITVNTSDYIKKTEAELIMEDLKALGIMSGIRVISTDQNQDSLVDTVRQGDFQVALFEISFSAVPDISTLLHGNSISYQNISRINDSTLNELLEELALSSEDGDRSLIFNKINQRFLETSPYIPLFFKQEVLARDAKIQQNINPTIFDRYGGLKDIHVPKR